MQGAARRGPGEDARADFYARIAEHQLAPLWEVIRTLLAREPTSDARPHVWRYAQTRPLLLESGALISAEEAERRVLVLENPGLPRASAVTETLYAGLQLILPGEVAPAHRHSPAAIRFVLEGAGAYTAVDGERAHMASGDLVLTPSWRWHDHAHPGDGPVIWLDVLDLPLLRALGPRFAEDYPERQFPASPAAPLSDAGAAEPGPAFRFPYAPRREALERMRRDGACDPCLGAKLEYTDATGGPVLPTISNFLQLLPSGFEGLPYLTTEASIYCVVEGRGHTVVGRGESAVTLAWGARDQFVVPRWQPHVHMCEEEAVLYSASDRGVQQKLGLWREERG
jgi:gentisate 1,2-dioxygenase